MNSSDDLPVVALVGRPNVGKSTLFNLITRTRDALVADFAGLTRDKQYGLSRLGEQSFIVVDTGGLTDETSGIGELMSRQAMSAIEESDLILFIVDAKSPVLTEDIHITQKLRKLGKKVLLVANKTDGVNIETGMSELYLLGLGEPLAISAAHNKGIHSLVEIAEEHFSAISPTPTDQACVDSGIKVAIVGRPNVGKSTLVNRFLGEERQLTMDMPGTTRDSISIPVERDGQRYILIDTAGVRRRSKVTETVEKFSVIKALQSIERCHVAIVMLDAQQGIVEQDATIISYVLSSGKALVLALNKWDGLSVALRTKAKEELARKLTFVTFADCIYISALHGSRIQELLDSVNVAYESATRSLKTPELTRLLQEATTAHSVPLSGGRSPRLRYAHPGGQNPPRILIHGNRVDKVSESYRRYLSNFFQKALKMRGTPIWIQFKGGKNPFEVRKKRTRVR